MPETMVTHIKAIFRGPTGCGWYETRGWDEELWETRNRLVQRVRETWGMKVKIELVYQAEDYYVKGTGTKIRTVAY